MFAWLVVMIVPLGNASVEPSRAFQVPAVRAFARDLCDGRIEAERSRLGFDGSRVAERAVDQDRRRAGAGGLLDRAGVVDLRLAAVVVRDAGVRLDKVRPSWLDVQDGRCRVIAVQREVAGPGLDDGAVVVQRAVVVEDLVVGAGEIDRPEVGQVAGRAADPPPSIGTCCRENRT